MPRFSVDTHLFRELGELLVGRDSTALVELVKNAYDADATEVIVLGEHLSDIKKGRITVRDNGTGMTSDVFADGFLRVASRLKEGNSPKSVRFGRRYTGAKGIGRLAAHKLASLLTLRSVPWLGEDADAPAPVLEASIDWNKVEARETLDELEGSDAIVVSAEEEAPADQHGTTISMARLRRPWTAEERARFFAEVQSFDAPAFLREPLPKTLVKSSLLFRAPLVREKAKHRLGGEFSVRLEGDFAAGEEYWQVVSQTAAWVVEIRAARDGRVYYAVAPTKRLKKESRLASPFKASLPHPSPATGPFFDARILVRVGEFSRQRDQRVWAARSSGIRVYLEGFRVLPYGESRDDWLGIDADYTRRRRTLDLLAEWSGSEALPAAQGDDDKDAPLLHLPNNNYIGAVFLTQSRATSLRALVNREGFVPEAGYYTLVELVRTGVDVCTRVRAAAGFVARQKKRRGKRGGASESASGQTAPEAASVREAVDVAVDALKNARSLVGKGNLKQARTAVVAAEAHIATVKIVIDALMGERALLRVVASVGTQMAAFVHEVNALLGEARTVERALHELHLEASENAVQQRALKLALDGMTSLRGGLERQASYLTDVMNPDARRRRARQSLADRFAAALSLVASQAQKRGITVETHFADDHRTPPMFAAEVTTVLANLLTNAVKAAGTGGRIKAFSRSTAEGGLRVQIENTGAAVKLAESEKWFRPFESTTLEVDTVLGQGMGLGLPITRAILREYGAHVRFVKPATGFATAIEIEFPE